MGLGSADIVLWGQWLWALLRTSIFVPDAIEADRFILRACSSGVRQLSAASCAELPLSCLPSSIGDLHVMHTCQHLFAGLQLACDGWMVLGSPVSGQLCDRGQKLHVSVGQLYTDLPSN